LQEKKKWHKLHKADMEPSEDYSSLLYLPAPQELYSQEHIPGATAEDCAAAC